MITAQILARSLANFYRHCDAARANNLFVIVKKMDASFSCVCPVIDNVFRHNIVNVVGGSTRLSPRGSTATLTIL